MKRNKKLEIGTSIVGFVLITNLITYLYFGLNYGFHLGSHNSTEALINIITYILGWIGFTIVLIGVLEACLTVPILEDRILNLEDAVSAMLKRESILLRAVLKTVAPDELPEEDPIEEKEV